MGPTVLDGTSAVAKNKAKRPIKVLHAPLNFANQALVLSRALAARGLSSTLLRYQFEGNTAVRFHDADDRVAEISRQDWLGDMLRNVQTIAAEGYDIVHFWNRTLLWRRPGDVFNAMDLPFIKLAGPRIAYRFTGYDLRRKSLEMQLNPYSPYRYGYVSSFDDDDQKRYLASIGCYVDQFIVQDAEMQSYCPEARIIPRALDLTEFPIAEPIPNPRPLVIHAPSRRALKGTEFVLQAIDALKEEGLDFDFQLIENLSNTEALERYRQCDIVVDQLLVGWYGVLSMEAMALGKTAIAYIRDDLTGYFRDGMPLLNANPDTIKGVLRTAIKDRELREETGRRGRAFVEEVHDSRVVARSAARLYKKMLATKVSARRPDFGYQLGRSAEFVQLQVSGEFVKRHRARLAQLEREVSTLKTAQERSIANILDKEIVATQELRALRHDAKRYNELKPELASLRYKSQRYDELKDVAMVWRAKANRLDRLTGAVWVKRIAAGLGFRRIPGRAAPRAKASKSAPTSVDAGSQQADGAKPPGAESEGVPQPPAAVQQRELAAGKKPSVCIVTRKRINNITRAPRMAKALVDAGWDVVVVSMGVPVAELREMCPQVQYVEVEVRPRTVERRQYWQERRRKRNADRATRSREFQAELARGGVRAAAARIGSLPGAISDRLNRVMWKIWVATPSAFLLKTKKEGFAETWRKLTSEDACGLAIRFVMVSNQWATTHAFAAAVLKATQGRRFDAVQAYDNYALVAAARLAMRDGAKLVYDAVELTSHRLGLNLNLLDKVRERLERREEARICRKADASIAIGEALAGWYARHYRRPRPVVVRNCRYYWPFQTDRRLRQDAGVGTDVRLLIWCGSGYPDQGIEFIIKVLQFLPAGIHTAIVAFYQRAWKNYGEQVLPALAASLGVANRVHFLPEREPNDLVPYISGADIGVIPSWGARVNDLISLPNKFHEMVMARLPLVSSRRGEVIDMIRRHEIGDVVDESDLPTAGVLIENMLDPSAYGRYKANVMKLAEDLSWEKESQGYIELFDRLARPPSRGGMVPPNRAAVE